MPVTEQLGQKVERLCGVAPFYQVGDVVLMHGDAFELLPKLRLLISAILTDPPYGVRNNCDYARLGHKGGSVKTGHTYDNIRGDTRQSVQHYVWLVTGMGKPTVMWGYNCFANLLPIGALLVWDKMKKGVILADGEAAWLNRGAGVYIFRHRWDGFSRDSEHHTAYHPTQKPVALMRWCLEKLKPSGVVCDPFCGSSSVLVACQQVGLPCVGIEYERKYCEVVARRMAERR